MVADLNNGLVLPQIPHDRFPAGVDRGQDVLDLPVPGDGANVFSRLKKNWKIVMATVFGEGKPIPNIIVIADADPSPLKLLIIERKITF